MPGDVITTGTPPGVGIGMKPPRFLKAGDTVALWHRQARRAEGEGRRLDEAELTLSFPRKRE